ncbi:hypothetical protein EGW08_005886 [Elysia chlorotica]|uniref:Uncharacterized protein n=1 Tax=Elysia chlorotica TaxID=188477 RepID=A0A3S1HUH2_ELYCH|nr:hypothetical protein EGW08_005886 [Elysia chlorotica]
METSPITRSIIRGEHSLVLESLRQGEDANAVCSRTGQGYLHIICTHARGDSENAWVPMVYQLSNAGVDLNHRDRTGCTATWVAIRRKLVQVLAALLKCGAHLDTAELEEAEAGRGVTRNDMLEVVRRFSPGYWEAVLDPNPFKVSRLVKAWARVNISRRGTGQTLIEFAKQNARDGAVVGLLLQHEASIELAHAVMAGDAQRTTVLLCNGGADLATADFSVRVPALHAFAPLSLRGAAERYGHVNILKLLQDRETGGPKSASVSPTHKAVYDWSSWGSLSSKVPDYVCQGRTGNRSMANQTSSAMCTVL